MIHEYLSEQDLLGLSCPPSPEGFFSVSTINDMKQIVEARSLIKLSSRAEGCYADYFVWDTIPRANALSSKFGGKGLLLDDCLSKIKSNTLTHFATLNISDSIDLFGKSQIRQHESPLVQLHIDRQFSREFISRFVVFNGAPVLASTANVHGELELPEMWATRIRIKIYPELTYTQEISDANGTCSILVPKGCFITREIGFRTKCSEQTIADEGIVMFSGIDIDIWEMHLGNGLNRFGPYFRNISYEQAEIMELDGQSVEFRFSLGDHMEIKNSTVRTLP